MGLLFLYLTKNNIVVTSIHARSHHNYYSDDYDIYTHTHTHQILCVDVQNETTPEHVRILPSPVLNKG